MKEKAVFVHIPKTGGASIREALKFSDVRIILHNLRDPHNVSLAQYIDSNPLAYSFAIVRNPWDRLLSAYFFLKKGGLKPEDKHDAERFVLKYRNFNEFVCSAFKEREILQQIHFRPQYLWISKNEEVIVDSIGRFENFQQSVSQFMKQVGLQKCHVNHLNKGTHKHYMEYYSKESIEIVRSVYSKDIDLFGYEIEPAPRPDNDSC